jgi:hypothetical protein
VFERDEEAALRIMPPAFTDIKDARLYHFIWQTSKVASYAKTVLLVSFSDKESPLAQVPPASPEPQ